MTSTAPAASPFGALTDRTRWEHRAGALAAGAMLALAASAFAATILWLEREVRGATASWIVLFVLQLPVWVSWLAAAPVLFIGLRLGRSRAPRRVAGALLVVTLGAAALGWVSLATAGVHQALGLGDPPLLDGLIRVSTRFGPLWLLVFVALVLAERRDGGTRSPTAAGPSGPVVDRASTEPTRRVPESEQPEGRRGVAQDPAGTPAFLRRLPVRAGDADRFLLVSTEQVVWLEAEGKRVRVHRRQGAPLTAPYLLGDLCGRLDASQFVRVSRSAAVNLECVVEIQPWFRGEHLLVLSDGTKLPTSPSHRQSLRQLLALPPR